ncbi:platelet-activating factor acetylhydrolase IB subunit [Paraglaciecola sp. L3A3]|uniref:platelet-activating factor acetylhydrolase IB subunit n=1 Tax=Paraglaciecola sp. L3A3 TaxID=2686358 RepID=UPI00131B5737|nr:platelet-activating factor acetylhydrolase IB subunit [Paraglaciecola sp. L3A3]
MKNIIVVLALLIAGCGSSGPVSEPLSIVPADKSSVNWWMPRHEEKLLSKDQMGKVDLVFLGDSITHFWERKAKKVWQQYYGHRSALNIGFSADRTENVLWRLENGEVDGIDPKLVVLMIGTNNTGHRQDAPKDTALGIKTILHTLETKLPNSKILLLAIFPRGASVDDPLRKINDDINLIIKDFDDGELVHYLDINHVFLDDKGNLSQTVMEDLLHPNPNQYKVWAEAMEPKIRVLMAEND